MNKDEFNEEFRYIESEVRHIVTGGKYLQSYSRRLIRFKERRMMNTLSDIADMAKDRKFSTFLEKYKSYINGIIGVFPKNLDVNDYFEGAGAHSKVSFVNYLRTVHNISSLVPKPARIVQIDKEGIDDFEYAEVHFIMSFVAEKIYRLLDEKRCRRRSVRTFGLILLAIFGILYTLNVSISVFFACVAAVVFLVYFAFIFIVTSGEFDIEQMWTEEIHFEYTTGTDSIKRLGIVSPSEAIGKTDFGLENFDILLPGNLLTNLECVLNAVEPIAKKLYTKGLLFKLPSDIDPESAIDVEEYIDSIKFSLSKDK